MGTSFSKTSAWAFVVTAAIYLLSVSFISYPVTTLLKPLPILCLIVGVGLAHLSLMIKLLLVLALGWSLIGDIVLTLPIALQLEFGIGSFFLAHCLYITLFLKSYQFNQLQFCYYIPVFVFVCCIALMLIPLLGGLLVPVLAYFIVLMTMVFTAFQVNNQNLVIGSGALLFLCSDVTLAINIFLIPGMDARIFIMFTYYAAQFLLTFGLVALYKPNR
ncbi:lysoplasmalogenase [Legionella waltersii]|uniref:Putative inner membrane protein n=2 Tax=Legionella waltersii TaxID=66969 RepID=A0A0W1ANQ2_9GAMM|nr:lysoplasmalogenase [Legionella waltersii]KTD82933.1 putative inner membrane protein [Legionella waltersii]SNV02379.1 putative inner membrane protein [Legionella waltersii]